MDLKLLIQKLTFIKTIGETNRIVTKVVSIFDGPFTSETITWVNNKNIQLVSTIEAGTIIVGTAPEEINPNVTYLVSENPRTAFKQIVDILYTEEDVVKVEHSAHIDSSSSLGDKCYIGHNVVIEKDCCIGENVKIGSNTVIKKGTIIGDNVTIGCNCTIGGVGFGYQKNESGNYELIKHIGIVKISNNVEIGNNTCIDRAVLGETFIGKNVKVDNLVHIAHNVKINSNALIIANAMVAGSCEIGSSTWVAPSSNIINGVKIGSDVTIGIGAVVLKSIEDGKIFVGNPAKELIKK